MIKIQALATMKDVVKKFPGVTALSGITFDILAGEVHVLLGENGAGKSTLMKILSGVHKPTSGTINLGGKEFTGLTPKDSRDNGISVIYQELSVINELSIQENLFVGCTSDPLGQMADTRAGMMSIGIGMAANISMKENRRVYLSEFYDELK